MRAITSTASLWHALKCLLFLVVLAVLGGSWVLTAPLITYSEHLGGLEVQGCSGPKA